MNGIRKKRLKANMTQAELAARIGVAQSSVAMWETGKIYFKAAEGGVG